MYPIEKTLKDFDGYVPNMCKLKDNMAKGYISLIIFTNKKFRGAIDIQRQFFFRKMGSSRHNMKILNLFFLKSPYSDNRFQ
jgi:hypothetical protein